MFCFQRVRGQNGSLGRLLDEFNNYRNSGNKKFCLYKLFYFIKQIVIYKTFINPIVTTDKLFTKHSELPQSRVS